jgi:EpsI family protein
MHKFRFPITIACLFLTLMGARWVEQTGGGPVRQSDELGVLEIPFRGWAELDLDLMPEEVAMIRPEAMLMRRYEAPNGEAVELTVIASRDKRSIHNAAYNLTGGAEVEQQRSRTIALSDRQIPVTHATLMNEKGGRSVAIYFFTDGNFATNSINRYQWNQLGKRLRGESTLGALVRVSAPIPTDSATADALTVEFTKAAFPVVLKGVRDLK